MHCNGNLEDKTFISHIITALPPANQDSQAQNMLTYVCMAFCLTKQNAILTHGRADIQFHTFLTLAVGGEWSASLPNSSTPSRSEAGWAPEYHLSKHVSDRHN